MEVISVSIMLLLPQIGALGLATQASGTTDFTGASWADGVMEVVVAESNDLLLDAIDEFNGRSGLVIKQVVGDAQDPCDLTDEIVSGDLTEDFCGNPYPDNTLAYATWRSDDGDTVDAGMVFNEAFDWGPNGLEPVYALIHELGHTVGLAHIPNESPSIMNPNYNEAWSQLQPQDIDNLVFLYGLPPAPEPSDVGFLPAINSILLY